MNKKIEQIFLGNYPLQSTESAKSVIGANVLAKNGRAIGKVADVRYSSANMKIEGILLDDASEKLYIGVEYISRITNDAVMLNITPSVLLKGKRVLTYEGKIIGKVAEVMRKEPTNEVKEIVVRSMLKRKTSIPASAIRIIGKSIMLQRKHNVRQRYIWQGA